MQFFSDINIISKLFQLNLARFTVVSLINIFPAESRAALWKKMRIIDKNTRYKTIRGAISVTNENGIIVTTNADSGNREEMQLGFDLIGLNAFT